MLVLEFKFELILLLVFCKSFLALNYSFCLKVKFRPILFVRIVLGFFVLILFISLII
nr:MAG TPA: hypothetical protein [Crassvirales sp.]